MTTTKAVAVCQIGHGADTSSDQNTRPEFRIRPFGPLIVSLAVAVVPENVARKVDCGPLHVGGRACPIASGLPELGLTIVVRLNVRLLAPIARLLSYSPERVAEVRFGSEVRTGLWHVFQLQARHDRASVAVVLQEHRHERRCPRQKNGHEESHGG